MRRSKIPDSIVTEKIIEEVNTNSSAPKQVEIQKGSSSTSMPLIDHNFSPLSKPYFHFILAKTHVKPTYNMVLPSRFCPNLPSTTGPEIRVPTTIECHGRTWETTLIVTPKVKRLEYKSWKAFVSDNTLRFGDALFWEVNESSNEKVKFKVQIIRGDFPAELEAKVNGMTKDFPIIVEDN